MIRAHEAKTDQKFTPAKAHILKGAHLAKARELAAAHHPKWDLLKESAQNLHTRNMCQVLGPELDKPARFVMPWTVDGGTDGGSGQAIRIDNHLNIPVLNVPRPAIRAALLQVPGIWRERAIPHGPSNPDQT